MIISVEKIINGDLYYITVKNYDKHKHNADVKYSVEIESVIGIRNARISVKRLIDYIDYRLTNIERDVTIDRVKIDACFAVIYLTLLNMLNAISNDNYNTLIDDINNHIECCKNKKGV